MASRNPDFIDISAIPKAATVQLGEFLPVDFAIISESISTHECLSADARELLAFNLGIISSADGSLNRLLTEKRQAIDELLTEIARKLDTKHLSGEEKTRGVFLEIAKARASIGSDIVWD